MILGGQHHENGWSGWMRIRIYLEDLNFLLLNIFNGPYEQIQLKLISDTTLRNMGGKYGLDLPMNQKLFRLIKNPFYLNEYLKFSFTNNEQTTLEEFKNFIWLRVIQNSTFKKGNIHINREACFLKIIEIKSKQRKFFVNSIDCNGDVLSALIRDEVIGYDHNNGGYFITHDIYEEWGLLKIIDRSFRNKSSVEDFFESIGNSIYTRRIFREWLSDGLSRESESIELIKPLINEALNHTTLPQFWKDEIITAALLSQFSSDFYLQFESELKEPDSWLIIRISFILRIACKQLDQEIHTLLSESNEENNLEYLFTKPKGSGWQSFIKFVHDNKNIFAIESTPYVLPVLDEYSFYNNKESLRYIGLICFHYYSLIAESNSRFDEDNKQQIIKVLLRCSNWIKSELGPFLNALLSNGVLDQRKISFDLCKYILGSKPEAVLFAKFFPLYVIKVADMFWKKDSTDVYPAYFSIKVEAHYGLNPFVHHMYEPASALQTPFYYHLHSDCNR